MKWLVICVLCLSLYECFEIQSDLRMQDKDSVRSLNIISIDKRFLDTSLNSTKKNNKTDTADENSANLNEDKEKKNNSSSSTVINQVEKENIDKEAKDNQNIDKEKNTGKVNETSIKEDEKLNKEKENKEKESKETKQKEDKEKENNEKQSKETKQKEDKEKESKETKQKEDKEKEDKEIQTNEKETKVKEEKSSQDSVNEKSKNDNEKIPEGDNKSVHGHDMHHDQEAKQNNEFEAEDSLARNAFYLTIIFLTVFVCLFIYNIIRCYTRSIVLNPSDRPPQKNFYSKDLQNITNPEDTTLDITS